MREKYLVALTNGADFDSCVGLLSDVGCIDGGYMAQHLRRIISTPVFPSMGGLARMGLSSSNGPFSDFGTSTSANNFDAPNTAADYVENTDYVQAVSLPPTRSTLPA